jgi:cytochrome P450
LLRERPELVAAAVDEVLRYEPITPWTARMTIDEVEFREVLVPAGTVVMVSTHAANRDPSLFERPDAFDIGADRGRAKLMTFGAGIHNCLGMNLAKAELQEALAFFAGRVESWTLDGEPGFGSVAGVYDQTELPIRFSVAD